MGFNDISATLVALSSDDAAWLRSFQVHTPGTDDGRIPAWFDADNAAAYDIETAMAPLHYLLCGATDGGSGPLSFLGNIELGEAVAFDFGRGPGRILPPAMVEATIATMERMSVRDLRQRLESDTLRSIFPFDGRTLEDDEKEWLLAALHGLMTFMRGVADAGLPLLVAWRGVSEGADADQKSG